MYVCILNQSGDVVFHRNMDTIPDTFIRNTQPFKEDMVVVVECMLTWYWLADLCKSEGIARGSDLCLTHIVCTIPLNSFFYSPYSHYIKTKEVKTDYRLPLRSYISV